MDVTKITQPLGVFTQPNAGNGDCLFYSIAQGINTYTGVASDELWKRMEQLGLTNQRRVTATQLRLLVYMLFLVPNPELDSILELWRTVAVESPEIGHEFAQARALPNKPIAELTTEERIRFFMTCMDPIVCWGDETALVFLERLLGIRCMVITNRVMQCRPFSGHRDDYAPLLYIPLSLSNMHYQSITWNDADGVEHAAYAEKELPDILLFLCQRDCARATQPYINLQHRIQERIGAAPDVPRDYVLDNSLLPHFAKCRSMYMRDVHKST